MGKLRNISAKQLCRILLNNGFKEIRQQGSHIVMQKIENETTTTTIVPNHKEIRIGTLQSIIRQSGLPKAYFER